MRKAVITDVRLLVNLKRGIRRAQDLHLRLAEEKMKKERRRKEDRNKRK